MNNITWSVYENAKYKLILIAFWKIKWILCKFEHENVNPTHIHVQLVSVFTYLQSFISTYFISNI